MPAWARWLVSAIFILAAAVVITVLPARAAIPLPYPQGTAFPLMMYEVNNPPTNAAAYTNYGWNIFQSYGLSTNSAINTFLHMCDTDNVSSVAVIPNNTDTNDNAVGWTQTQVQTWILGSDTNANLAWWSLPEEMRWWVASEAALLTNYATWTRTYDPQRRPTYEYTPNNRSASDIASTAPGVDVLGISCYCESLGMPHAWVRYKLQQAGGYGVTLAGKTLGSNYLAGQKTLVAVLYCATNTTEDVATPAQCYHDVWSALASGAQGIALYAWWHAIHDTPSLTNNLQQYNIAAAQISGSQSIGPMILFGTANTNVAFTITSGPTNTVTFSPPGATNVSYPSLNLLCKTWANKIYLIAVNSTSNTVTATLTHLPVIAATAVLPFETNSVPVTNASLAATFPAWGVHVYAITPPAPVISSVALANGLSLLTYSNLANISYVLQRSTNLYRSSGWIAVSTNTTATSGSLTFTNTPGKIPTFYRLQIP